MKTKDLNKGEVVAYRRGKYHSTQRAIVLDTAVWSRYRGEVIKGRLPWQTADSGIPLMVERRDGEWVPLFALPQTIVSTWAEHLVEEAAEREAAEAAKAERIRRAAVEAVEIERRAAVRGSIFESLEALGLASGKDWGSHLGTVEFRSADAFEVLAEVLAEAVAARKAVTA